MLVSYTNRQQHWLLLCEYTFLELLSQHSWGAVRRYKWKQNWSLIYPIPTFTVLNWRWTREDGWLLLHEVSILQGSCVKQATTHGTYFGLLLFLHSNLLLDLEACVANQAGGSEVAIWGTLLTKDNAFPPPSPPGILQKSYLFAFPVTIFGAAGSCSDRSGVSSLSLLSRVGFVAGLQ